MFQALALSQSERGANAQNVSFETHYGDQFTLSNQLIIPNTSSGKQLMRSEEIH